jgi:hypothetical protein
LLIGWPGKEAANIFSSMVCPYYFIFDWIWSYEIRLKYSLTHILVVEI